MKKLIIIIPLLLLPFYFWILTEDSTNKFVSYKIKLACNDIYEKIFSKENSPNNLLYIENKLELWESKKVLTNFYSGLVNDNSSIFTKDTIQEHLNIAESDYSNNKVHNVVYITEGDKFVCKLHKNNKGEIKLVHVNGVYSHSHLSESKPNFSMYSKHINALQRIEPITKLDRLYFITALFQ